MVSSASNCLQRNLHTYDLVMLAVDAGSHGPREPFLESLVSTNSQLFFAAPMIRSAAVAMAVSPASAGCIARAFRSSFTVSSTFVTSQFHFVMYFVFDPVVQKRRLNLHIHFGFMSQRFEMTQRCFLLVFWIPRSGIMLGLIPISTKCSCLSIRRLCSAMSPWQRYDVSLKLIVALQSVLYCSMNAPRSSLIVSLSILAQPSFTRTK